MPVLSADCHSSATVLPGVIPPVSTSPASGIPLIQAKPAANNKSSRSPGTTISVPRLKTSLTRATERAVKLIRLIRRVFASPTFSHVASSSVAISHVRGTDSESLNGTTPIRRNASVLNDGDKRCTSCKKVGSKLTTASPGATGWLSKVLGTSCTRINITPSVRVSMTPPNSRAWTSSLSAR